MIGPALVGPHLQHFFTDHLVEQRRLSPQTIASYRDTFRLLLQFVHRETGVEPASLSIPELNVDRIQLRFLASATSDHSTATNRAAEPCPACARRLVFALPPLAAGLGC